MPRHSFFFYLLVLVLLFAGPGCDSSGGGHDHDHDADGHAHDDGDHDHDHDHDDDHDHDHADDGADHGEAHALGEAKLGDTTVKVTQFGDIAGGTEAAFGLEVTSGAADSVRVWVGAQNGRGSIKALAEEEGDKKYHAHVECPILIAADHLLWIEIENAGKKLMTGVPLHR